MASSPPTSLSLSLDSLFSPNHHLSPSSLPFPSSSSVRRTHNFFPIKSLQTPQTQAPNNPFLDPVSILRLNTLKSFNFTHEFSNGSLRIRPMKPEETEPTVRLLTDSFAESLWTYDGYVKLLEFFVRQYVVERRNLVPHSVMLVGFYEEGEENGEGEGEEEGQPELACTAEVSFDARGANAAPPTPLPPKNCPYICNMTVKKQFRRRGIGRQLLKACEELISQMKTIRRVYLHCRMIDTVPFEMYKKAGYNIVQADSILVWLSFQRRKYLMCKELPPVVESPCDDSKSDDRRM